MPPKLFNKIGSGIRDISRDAVKSKIIRGVVGTAVGVATANPVAGAAAAKGLKIAAENATSKLNKNMIAKESLGDKLERLADKPKQVVSNVKEQLENKISGGVTFGRDQTKGLIPIVLAGGLVLFMLIRFGGGLLFASKKRKR